MNLANETSETICIFTFNFQNWQFATSLEIMRGELVSGNDVFWFDCAGKFREKIQYPLADKTLYFLVRRRIQRKKLVASLALETNGKLKYLNNEYENDFTPEPEIEKLAEEVAYLELIATLKESEPVPSDHAKILSQYRETFLRTYYATEKILLEGKISKVFLYNGRFLQERAVWTVCTHLKIKVVFYEKCNSNWHDRYLVFEEPIHNPDFRSRIMNQFGNDYSQIHDDWLVSASNWFDNRISGLTQSFTRLQKQGLDRSRGKPFVVFFHSSEDELITTDLISETWGKQNNALFRLVENLVCIENLELVIRTHPNLSYKSVEERKVWAKIGVDLLAKYDWISFLRPNSEVNSYELIMQSEGVITVGSTIGVEAAFLGKKSILMGRAFHENMGITFNPINDQELTDLLNGKPNTEMLLEKKINAMKYAIFHEFGGMRMSHITYHNKRNHTFYKFYNFKINYPLFCSILLRIDSIIANIRKFVQKQVTH